MPLAGGSPVRRTFDGGGARVVGFAPDGALVYATRRYSTLPDTQLFRLDLGTGERTPVPLAQAADGCWTPDGRTLFFTRLPFQGSHTKRYRGGTAQSLWKYAEGAAEAVPLTGDYAGTSKTPMWWDGRVYFLSDRDGTMNVWSMDEERPRPAPAHAPPGLGRGPGVALGRPDRLQAGSRPAPPRPRERHRRGRSTSGSPPTSTRSGRPG